MKKRPSQLKKRPSADIRCDPAGPERESGGILPFPV